MSNDRFGRIAQPTAVGYFECKSNAIREAAGRDLKAYRRAKCSRGPTTSDASERSQSWAPPFWLRLRRAPARPEGACPCRFKVARSKIAGAFPGSGLTSARFGILKCELLSSQSDDFGALKRVARIAKIANSHQSVGCPFQQDKVFWPSGRVIRIDNKNGWVPIHQA